MGHIIARDRRIAELKVQAESVPVLEARVKELEDELKDVKKGRTDLWERYRKERAEWRLKERSWNEERRRLLSSGMDIDLNTPPVVSDWHIRNSCSALPYLYFVSFINHGALYFFHTD